METRSALELQQILEQDDLDACLRFFAQATEAERRALSGIALAAMPAEGPLISPFRESRWWQVRAIAVLATCSFAELKQRGWLWLPEWDHVCAVLAARRPDWIDEFAETILHFSTGWWGHVRRLVREGLCRKPRTEKYVIGMLNYLRYRPARETRTLREQLLADPELLDDEVWRLFEIEGGKRVSFTTHDGHTPPDRRWDQTLLALSEEGRLSRSRLLDASLDALARDFDPYQARWFSRFHDLLAPTDEECLGRADRYLALLSCRNSATVSWALKAVKRTDELQPIEGRKLIAALRPLLYAPQKATAISALAMLEGLVQRAPELSSMVALMVAEGLDHDDTDVQAAAIRFLERHRRRSPAQRDRSLFQEAVARRRDHVAASLRGRLDDLAGPAAPSLDAPPAAPAWDWPAWEARWSSLDPELAAWAGVPQAMAAAREGRLDLTALEFDGTETPRLDPAAKLRPIADLDELVDVCAALLDGPMRIDDLERAFDGISRLCGQRPDDFATRIEPLREIVRKVLRRDVGPFSGWSAQGDLAGVVLSWIAEALTPPKHARSKWGGAVWQWSVGKDNFKYPRRRRRGVLGFLSRRSLALAVRASRRVARPLLSAPTHSGGWIDPVVLVERTRAWLPHRGRPENADRILALLRLAPDRRGEALGKAADLTDEFGQALRYALGETRFQLGPNTALWVAAARARCPYGDDPLLEGQSGILGPDAATAAQYAWRVERVTRIYAGRPEYRHQFYWETQPAVPQELHRNLVTVEFHASSHRREPLGEPTVDTVRWVATVWPIARESFFTGGVEAFLSTVAEENRAYLEFLLDPDTPLKPMALLLLVLGLGASLQPEQDLAAQALTAAIEDGRIDDAKLGEVLGRLLLTRLVQRKCWASSLGQVARTSPLHGHVVRAAIERSLQGDPSHAPHDLYALVELLRELVFEAGDGLHSETARAFLRQLKRTSRAGKAAQALLGGEAADPAGRWAEIMPAVVEHRLERAERWASWRSIYAELAHLREARESE